MANSVRPQIQVGMTALRSEAERMITRVVVDTDAHLPDMFEITFMDQTGSILVDAGIEIGSEITIFAGAYDSSDAPKLIVGEVTSIEGELHDLVIETIVRGYEKAHRLQRGKKTRNFPNAKDSDIARQIASQGGLQIDTIDATTVTHDVLSQVNQTDWDFLRGRAREVGYEMGMVNGKFYFAKPKAADPSLAGGGLGGAMSAAASMAGVGGPVELKFKENLISFRPRITGAQQVSDVMVRAMNPDDKAAMVGSAPAKSVSAKIEQTPQELAGAFGWGSMPSIPSLPSIPGMPSLGAPSTGKEYVVVDRPLATQAAVDAVAKAVAEHVASTFAEAEGIAEGNPAVQAGAIVDIKDVQAVFAGKWVVTRARHIVEGDGIYRTHFFISGRQDRSLLGLASMGATNGDGGFRIPGLVPAVISDNNDPDKIGRVKLIFPWLSSTYTSDWSRVVMFGAGKKGGSFFPPEPGDEVLVGFEFGDMRRPYVVGSLYSKGDADKPVMSGLVNMGKVKKRFIESRNGHRIEFDDDMSKSGINIFTKEQKVSILADASQSGQEKLTIEVKGSSAGGIITIDAQGAMTVEAKGGNGAINLKATNITIEAQTQLNLKGKAITIDGQKTDIKGNPINLN